MVNREVKELLSGHPAGKRQYWSPTPGPGETLLSCVGNGPQKVLSGQPEPSGQPESRLMAGEEGAGSRWRSKFLSLRAPLFFCSDVFLVLLPVRVAGNLGAAAVPPGIFSLAMGLMLHAEAE